jgi:hypothetical protein
MWQAAAQHSLAALYARLSQPPPAEHSAAELATQVAAAVKATLAAFTRGGAETIGGGAPPEAAGGGGATAGDNAAELERSLASQEALLAAGSTQQLLSGWRAQLSAQLDARAGQLREGSRAIGHTVGHATSTMVLALQDRVERLEKADAPDAPPGANAGAGWSCLGCRTGGERPQQQPQQQHQQHVGE